MKVTQEMRNAYEFEHGENGTDYEVFQWYFNLNADAEEIKPVSANERQEGGSHYKDMDIQPWDVVDTWPIEQRIGFYRGNALKYIMRMGTKDEAPQEIRKCGHYCQKLAEVLEESEKE